MKKLFADFKKFIARGNVLDMAVGVIIGAAFSAIVTSLVQDIITPVISISMDVKARGVKRIRRSGYPRSYLKLW